ncbi:MAG: DinB family protein [Bacteroidota bacterium]
MNLQEVKLLHAYNAWANNRILGALASVPDKEYMQDLKSSHGSLHGTMVHIVAAEKLWQSRWHGTSDATLLSTGDVPSLPALKSLWEEVGRGMARSIGTMTDKKLAETFRVTSLAAGSVTLTYWQSLQHIVDHSSYHRGQIVALLRQLGFTPPTTSMLLFYRDASKVR